MSFDAQDRFSDYFVICGLDELDGLERHHSLKDNTATLTPLQTSYKCSILWHFPETDSSNIFEADAIKLLCMPRGVYFHKHVQPNKQKFHSFLQTKEDGTKIFGYVLTFYERVWNENILSAMETLFKMYNTELLISGSQNSWSNSCSRSSCTKENNFQSFNASSENLYVSKSICLLMKKPFVSLSRQCLEDILTVALNEDLHDLRVESYIYNILYEIPSPPPGTTLKCVALSGDPNVLHNPNTNELPYFDYSMKDVLMTLGFDNLVDLFTCMLLEHQILFLSNDLNKLMLVAESLTTLFFPLLWQHVYVPVLPPSLLHFLDAPVPFIMGLYYETEEEKDRFEIPEASLCLLDIDNNDLLLPQEIPELPGREDIIKELKFYADMYTIHPPEGSIRLRKDFESMDELNSDSTCECPRSKKYGSCSNLATPNTGTWPRKKSMTPSMGRKNYSNNSPTNTSKKKHSITPSPMTIRKTLVASNWAGEITPQIHRESDLSSRKIISKKVSASSIANPRLAKMISLAEKAGMNTSDLLKGMKEPISDVGAGSLITNKDDYFVMASRATTIKRKQQHENEFNIVVQEIFANCFTQMLVDYEHFVILPQQTREDWLHNREHMQNFDKASFLSDQSQMSLSFMTLFVETQGFASLIDMKIMALWEDCDPKLAFFDKRIDKLKVKLGVIRNPVYERCTTINYSIENYVQKCSQIDYTAVQPHALKTHIKRDNSFGYFPCPDKTTLLESKKKKGGRVNWKKREKLQQQQEHNILNEAMKNSTEAQKIKEKLADRVKKYMQESKTNSKENIPVPVTSHKTLHAFGEKLLKECMIKTKRLVILKLGQEAVELGHTDPNTGVIEENTLIASICDLLERVWCHGVQLRQLEFGKESAKSKFVQRMRQSKSALWSHLLAFYQKETSRLAAVYGLPNTEKITDDVRKLLVEMAQVPQPHTPRKTSTVDLLSGNINRIMRNISPETDYANASDAEKYTEDKGSLSSPITPNISQEKQKQIDLHEKMDLVDNLRTVLNMKEIKTDTGYARAWTRLSLEKKVLAKDLRILVSHKRLLMTRYKDYAFIRTDDEMEQFLYHLLSLNAVDFFCFTNGFSNTLVIYKVTIIIGKHIGSSTSANCWINLTGSFGHTGTIYTPKGDMEFQFRHKNLGILNALRIGHDSSGISPSWFIDYVNITNQITGRQYKFPCHRWLAKGQDDGSTERLLIAEVVGEKNVNERRSSSTLCLGISDKPQSSSSLPTTKKRSTSLFSKKLSYIDIQEKLADAINKIVKYFFKDSDENMTLLLCGENGFCDSLELAFRHGFKSNRFFSKKIFIWDYLEKVCEDVLDTKLLIEGGDVIKRNYLTTIKRINSASLSIGKDQKFQLLICLGLRDHNLQQWFELLHVSPITCQMYETSSFFRERSLLNFLIDVLDSLTEFDVVLDKSITRGI